MKFKIADHFIGLTWSECDHIINEMIGTVKIEKLLSCPINWCQISDSFDCLFTQNPIQNRLHCKAAILGKYNIVSAKKIASHRIGVLDQRQTDLQTITFKS